MKIAKPLLLISTPIGVAAGLHAAWTYAGGLVFLMAAMVAVMGCAIGSVVYTIRREEREERERRETVSNEDIDQTA